MIRTQILKYLPGAREGERELGKEDVRGRATVRGAMEKNRYVRINEGKEVKTDDPIKYLLSTLVGSTV